MWLCMRTWVWKGDGTGKTQGEHLEPNSSVFPRSSLLHNLSQECHYHIWPRGKGLDALFRGEYSFPLSFLLLTSLAFINSVSALWNVQEPGSMPPHPLHAPSPHPKCSPVTENPTKRWTYAMTHLGLWSMLFLLQGHTVHWKKLGFWNHIAYDWVLGPLTLSLIFWASY